MSSAMNTARKALDKAGRGGKPLRYRPDESEGLFMDLKDHIFPMVGGVVTLASQGHLPFPRQGVGYEKDAVLASELPLMRRGNMGAFDEQEDMNETGGVDGTILAPQRPGLEPGKDAPKFGLMAIQAKGRELVIHMQAADGGRPGKVAFPRGDEGTRERAIAARGGRQRGRGAGRARGGPAPRDRIWRPQRRPSGACAKRCVDWRRWCPSTRWRQPVQRRVSLRIHSSWNWHRTRPVHRQV